MKKTFFTITCNRCGKEIKIPIEFQGMIKKIEELSKMMGIWKEKDECLSIGPEEWICNINCRPDIWKHT